MYYVYNAGLWADNLQPSFVQSGWLNNSIPGRPGTKSFDIARSFSSFDEADKAAKEVGWKRYVILQVPVVTVCECENLSRLLGDPDEWDKVLEEF